MGLLCSYINIPQNRNEDPITFLICAGATGTFDRWLHLHEVVFAVGASVNSCSIVVYCVIILQVPFKRKKGRRKAGNRNEGVRALTPNQPFTWRLKVNTPVNT